MGAPSEQGFHLASDNRTIINMNMTTMMIAADWEELLLNAESELWWESGKTLRHKRSARWRKLDKTNSPSGFLVLTLKTLRWLEYVALTGETWNICKMSITKSFGMRSIRRMTLIYDSTKIPSEIICEDGKVKVKLSLCFNWAPRQGGVLGEWMYSSAHSWTWH
jgi:hypothetical protein